MLFSLVGTRRRFGSTCCYHLQGRKVRRAGKITVRYRVRTNGRAFRKSQWRMIRPEGVRWRNSWQFRASSHVPSSTLSTQLYLLSWCDQIVSLWHCPLRILTHGDNRYGAFAEWELTGENPNCRTTIWPSADLFTNNTMRTSLGSDVTLITEKPAYRGLIYGKAK
jgi:hypothetical protein